MHQPATALIPHATGRLRRRASMAQDHAVAAASAVNWLADLASEFSASASPSLMFVQGEPVIVDISDFRLRPGSEAVVIRHDGSLAIDTVEHRSDDIGEARRGWGAWQSSPLPGCRAQRTGVTILGRVIARATQRLAA